MRILLLVLVLLMGAPAYARGRGSVHVRGYVTKKGTYVAPHVRKKPVHHYAKHRAKGDY